MQLLAQRADLLRGGRAQLVERATDPAGRLGELVGQLARALAREPGLAGRRLERLGRGGPHRVRAARRSLVVLLLAGHGQSLTRRLVSSPRVAPSTLHVRPTAPLAERALLPGDPGRALALAQALFDEPARMFNHNRG